MTRNARKIRGKPRQYGKRHRRGGWLKNASDRFGITSSRRADNRSGMTLTEYDNNGKKSLAIDCDAGRCAAKRIRARQLLTLRPFRRSTAAPPATSHANPQLHSDEDSPALSNGVVEKSILAVNRHTPRWACHTGRNKGGSRGVGDVGLPEWFPFMAQA